MALGRAQIEHRVRARIIPETRHIAAVLVVRIADAVHLSDAPRIGTDIVRSKVERPHGHLCKIENPRHHRIDKFRIVNQIERNGRITDVRRTDAAVGIAFLGQKQQVSFCVLHKFVRTNTLTKRGAGKRIIILPHLFTVGSQLSVKCRTLCQDLIVFRSGFIHRIDDSLSLAEVIPFEPFAEIKDGDLVVKRRHKVPLYGAADGEEVAPLALFAQVLCPSRREIDVERGVRNKEALLPRKICISPVGRGDVVRVGHDQIA